MAVGDSSTSMETAPSPTIFVDVSETLVTRGATGIQRVVRRIVEEGEGAAGQAGYDWVPVVATGCGLCRLNAAGADALAHPAREGSAASSPASKRNTVARLLKACLALAPSLYERARIRKLDRAFEGLILPDPVRLRQDDIYLVLDSFWLRSAAPWTVERLRRRGHAVVVVIYDVLALTSPHFFVGELPALLQRGFHRMAAAGARFVSISADAAAQTCDALPLELRTPVLHFPLGHDIASVEKVKNHAPAVPSLLIVSTLEPRKNHGVVLDAVEQLWADGWLGTLTIVGKQGWGVDALMQRLALHPERGRRLFVEHGASDEHLTQAYRAATATIMPSFAEGFGLPIIESMAAGIPVIASDIPVFREILGDDPLLFDPRDPADLVRSIKRLLSDLPRHRDRAASFRWPDWRMSASAFIAQVVRQVNAASEGAAVATGRLG